MATPTPSELRQFLQMIEAEQIDGEKLTVWMREIARNQWISWTTIASTNLWFHDLAGFLGTMSPHVEWPSPEALRKLWTPIRHFEWTVRANNVLRNAGIRWAWQLASLTEPEILHWKNAGKHTLLEFRAYLELIGLSLGMKLPSVPPPKPPE